MEIKYRHLSEYERSGIDSCLRAGVSKSEIARNRPERKQDSQSKNIDSWITTGVTES